MPDYRRLTEDNAADTDSDTEVSSCAIHYQQLQYRLCGPGGGGCSVGATGLQVRRGSGLRGAMGFRDVSGRGFEGKVECWMLVRELLDDVTTDDKTALLC